jgi:hypothetical protein
LTPHRLLPTRDKEPNVLGNGRFVPNMHGFETQTPFLSGGAEVLPRNLSTRFLEVRARPKECSQYRLNLFNHFLWNYK